MTIIVSNLWSGVYGFGNPLSCTNYPWNWWLPAGNGLWHLVPAIVN